MVDPAPVAEHLRVIRSLMERANVYRAISVPTALLAGVFSAISVPLLPLVVRRLESSGPAFVFCLWWGVVLAVVLCANFVFIWRGARRGGRSFVSPAMKLALRSLLPPAILAVFLTVFLFNGAASDTVLFAVLWPCFYGVGLLATQHFAPRSMVALGWSFLAFGLALGASLEFRPPALSDPVSFAAAMMGVSFGGIHILYALVVWCRHRRDGEPPAADE